MTFVNPLGGSEYEQAWGPWAGTHRHGQNWQSGSAWDLLTAPTTRIPVFAPVSGTVVSAGAGGAGRFAGMKVGIEADPMSAFLTHMSALVVDKGARVEAGEQVGWSGKANGVYHLHIALGGPEYFDSDDDNGIDPGPFLKASATALGTGPHGYPLYRGNAGFPAVETSIDAEPPFGGSLRLTLNGVRLHGWAESEATMRAIAENGLSPEDRASIAWKKRLWRGPEVEGVVRNLVKRFLTPA